MLNSNPRINKFNSYYYDLIQTYENNICSPDIGINMYSFGLPTVYHQPSGSCNLSKFDQVFLEAIVDNSINNKNNAKFKAYAIL